MSILGRKLEGNPDWTKSDRNLVTAAPILLVIDSVVAMIPLVGAVAHSAPTGLVAIGAYVTYVSVVLAALWSGLPVVAQAAPAPKESVYRPGPRVPAIEAPGPSFTFMRMTLGLMVGAHLLAFVAALAFGLLALVVLGLLWAVCSKH